MYVYTPIEVFCVYEYIAFLLVYWCL